LTAAEKAFPTLPGSHTFFRVAIGPFFPLSRARFFFFLGFFSFSQLLGHQELELSRHFSVVLPGFFSPLAELVCAPSLGRWDGVRFTRSLVSNLCPFQDLIPAPFFEPLWSLTALFSSDFPATDSSYPCPGVSFQTPGSFRFFSSSSDIPFLLW